MSLRLFAALDIPDAIADSVRPFMRGVPGAKWRPRENLHITLRFFGEIDERRAEDLDAALDEAAARVPPFNLALKGAGFFGGADPHALYLGVAADPGLALLAAACERAARRCGLKPAPMKYLPHMTIAYLRNADLVRVQAFETRLGLYKSEAWRADQFALFSSITRRDAPSHYQAEAEYFLRG